MLGNANYLKVQHSTIQDKHNRQEKRIAMKYDEQRRTFWLKVISIINAHTYVTTNLSIQVKFENDKRKR